MGYGRCKMCRISIVQAEAFVPESVVRVGSRLHGRQGVQSHEVHDTRVRSEVHLFCHEHTSLQAVSLNGRSC